MYRFAFLTVVSIVAFAFFPTFILAEGGQEGPVVTDTSKSAKIVAGPKTPIDRTAPIDLGKTPWLVESAHAATAGSGVFNRERLLWADPIRFLDNKDGVGNEIVVEKWVNDAPKNEELSGKYIFVEVWATWCPPCRRSLPLLNFFQEKFKDKLVVVAICEAAKGKDGEALDYDETLAALKNLANIEGTVKPDDIKFHLAIDTGRRFANKIGVFGIPHAVLIEPTEGVVVWEGMPTWIGYELDDVTLGKYISIGEKQKAAGLLPEKPPVVFTAKPVDPNVPAERPKVEAKYGEGCCGAKE